MPTCLSLGGRILDAQVPITAPTVPLPVFWDKKLQLLMKPQISTSGTSKKTDHLLLCQGAHTARASNQAPQFE